MSNYLSLLDRSVRGELSSGYNEEISGRDIEKCQMVIDRIQREHPFVLTKYPHLKSATTFAKIINYTKKNSEKLTYVSQLGTKNLMDCAKKSINNRIEGDFVEAGVLNGGCGILLAGVINELKSDKKVYLADSFEGLPEPSKHDSDFDNYIWYPYANHFDEHILNCKCDMETVEANFKKYNLLQVNVHFIKGWFNESLINSPIKQISVLRIDADWYDSTKCVLDTLGPKVSSGGYIIIDDYNLEGCKKAVDEYLAKQPKSYSVEYADKESGIIYWRV